MCDAASAGPAIRRRPRSRAAHQSSTAAPAGSPQPRAWSRFLSRRLGRGLARPPGLARRSAAPAPGSMCPPSYSIARRAIGGHGWRRWAPWTAGAKGGLHLGRWICSAMRNPRPTNALTSSLFLRSAIALLDGSSFRVPASRATSCCVSGRPASDWQAPEVPRRFLLSDPLADRGDAQEEAVSGAACWSTVPVNDPGQVKHRSNVEHTMLPDEPARGTLPLY